MAQENANSIYRRLILTWEHSISTWDFDDPTDQERNALLQSGIDPEGIIGFNRNFHYIEYVLRKGDNLYI